MILRAQRPHLPAGPAPDLAAGLPPEWPGDPWPEIVPLVSALGRKLVVLDDDPTGTQTVHDVPVLTHWDIDALERELRTPGDVFYILTNSRSLPSEAAVGLSREIARNLRAAALRARRDFSVVSRSDSTLRGHFPGEMDALAGSLGLRGAPWLLVPFFEAGGRRTIGDVHYLSDAGRLVPVGETEFARDPVFGYKASNLRSWVEEKTAGRIRASSVASLSLEEIRRGGPGKIRARLGALPAGSVCVVNAASLRDLDVFVLGLLQAESDGGRFLYRTAASFVAARAGIRARPPLAAGQLLLPPGRGGLTVVGSHVDRTSAQLERLLSRAPADATMVDVAKLLDRATQNSEIDRAAAHASRALGHGRDTVVYTSRQLVKGATADASIAIARQVSEALIAIVQRISVEPRYLLAKGGITSSDLAVKALQVRRATVLGQLQPGVPVWRLEPPCRWPGLNYIVFPGNVGGPAALVAATIALSGTPAS